MTEKPRHVDITKGRLAGHWLRRVIHVGQFAAPLVYYAYGTEIAGFVSLSSRALLWVLLALVVVAEITRLRSRIVFYGQRDYERRRISAFAFGFVAIVLVLLFAPARGFGIAIIWSCAFIDPLLGELRNHFRTLIVFAVGMIGVLLVWLLCAYWFQIAWWWALLMAPVTVVAEAWRVRWIDDNAVMMLVPLALVLVVHTMV